MGERAEGKMVRGKGMGRKDCKKDLLI